MTTIARARRQIQQLGPYQSLAVLMVPMALVEPIKIVALFVAGTGHWFSGTVMMVATYAASILLIERLFKVVKPKFDDVELVCNLLDLDYCVTQQNSYKSTVAEQEGC
jgi:hypothetical protein